MRPNPLPLADDAAAASKRIGERLTSETDRKLVQEYLASLDMRN